MTDKNLSSVISDSLDFLEILKEEGLVVVPSEPTPEMIFAGMRATGRKEDEVRSIFTAMIKAEKSEHPLAIN